VQAEIEKDTSPEDFLENQRQGQTLLPRSLYLDQLCRRLNRNPADFNRDGDIDFINYAIFVLAWLTQKGEAQFNPLCDINIPPDESIDWMDLKVFVDNWLESVE